LGKNAIFRIILSSKPFVEMVLDIEPFPPKKNGTSKNNWCSTGKHAIPFSFHFLEIS